MQKLLENKGFPEQYPIYFPASLQPDDRSGSKAKRINIVIFNKYKKILTNVRKSKSVRLRGNLMRGQVLLSRLVLTHWNILALYGAYLYPVVTKEHVATRSLLPRHHIVHPLRVLRGSRLTGVDWKLLSWGQSAIGRHKWLKIQNFILKLIESLINLAALFAVDGVVS